MSIIDWIIVIVAAWILLSIIIAPIVGHAMSLNDRNGRKP